MNLAWTATSGAGAPSRHPDQPTVPYVRDSIARLWGHLGVIAFRALDEGQHYLSAGTPIALLDCNSIVLNTSSTNKFHPPASCPALPELAPPLAASCDSHHPWLQPQMLRPHLLQPGKSGLPAALHAHPAQYTKDRAAGFACSSCVAQEHRGQYNRQQNLLWAYKGQSLIASFSAIDALRAHPVWCKNAGASTVSIALLVGFSRCLMVSQIHAF
eukprot:1161904-Pelagomonas_calceolata.AAC.17